MPVQRERLEADVLIVGAGPAGLACALHLASLIKKHNESAGSGKSGPQLSAENVYVLEKGREIGAHQLSGAILNPKALAELVPDFEKSAPLDTPVTDSAALLFTESSSFRFPVTPPPFQNKGNYVVSLNRIVKGLAGFDRYVRGWLDLRLSEQSRIHRPCIGAGICRPAIRSTRCLSKVENASVRQEVSRWRKASALRREIAALRRLVRDAAQYRG